MTTTVEIYTQRLGCRASLLYSERMAGKMVYNEIGDKYICILGCLIAYANENRTSHMVPTRRLGHKKAGAGACCSCVILWLLGSM